LKVKLTIVLIFFAFSSIFSACLPHGNRGIYDDSGIKASDRLEQIISALDNKNADEIIAMFSVQALREAPNIEDGIEYLFSFVPEKIVSWEKVAGSSSSSNDYGIRTAGSSYWFYVYTENDKYLFFLKEYTIDTENPENIGLYMLQVIKAEDKETQFDGGGPNTRCAGIYMPPGGAIDE